MSDSSYPLSRLLDWLASQRGWIAPPLHKTHHIGPGIEAILDLYIAHGASSQVQTAFNALAARHKDHGRVPLRLRVRPSDLEGLTLALEKSGKALTSIQQSEAQKAVEAGDIVGALQHLNLSQASKRLLQPSLVGAGRNPLFDLWLVLLDPEAASRIRRCPGPECGKFFGAWPQKKSFCSDACHNRFWSRPRRRASGHSKPRKNRPPRTR